MGEGEYRSKAREALERAEREASQRACLRTFTHKGSVGGSWSKMTRTTLGPGKTEIEDSRGKSEKLR